MEEQLIKELTNNGDVTDDAIDPLYPGSLFKLPRFVARGLQIKCFLASRFDHLNLIFKMNTLPSTLGVEMFGLFFGWKPR